jgi:hypothetical protein
VGFLVADATGRLGTGWALAVVGLLWLEFAVDDGTGTVGAEVGACGDCALVRGCAFCFFKGGCSETAGAAIGGTAFGSAVSAGLLCFLWGCSAGAGAVAGTGTGPVPADALCFLWGCSVAGAVAVDVAATGTDGMGAATGTGTGTGRTADFLCFLAG